jgi:hypothetical protein
LPCIRCSTKRRSRTRPVTNMRWPRLACFGNLPRPALHLCANRATPAVRDRRSAGEGAVRDGFGR